MKCVVHIFKMHISVTWHMFRVHSSCSWPLVSLWFCNVLYRCHSVQP